MVASQCCNLPLAARLHSLSGQDLPSVMRRSTMVPVRQFAIVAILDYLTIVTASLALDWRDGDRLSVALVVRQGRNILSFAHISRLLEEVNSGPLNLIIALVGLSFGVMIIARQRGISSSREPLATTLLLLQISSFSDAFPRRRPGSGQFPTRTEKMLHLLGHESLCGYRRASLRRPMHLSRPSSLLSPIPRACSVP